MPTDVQRATTDLRQHPPAKSELTHAEALDVIQRTREYVAHRGNWSAFDGRRQLILGLLDNDPRAVQVSQ